MFDIYYTGTNSLLHSTYPFAKKYTEDANPLTKMYWLVDSDIEIVDHSIFEYRPPAHQEQYEHIWKWNSKNYGGVRLLPKKSPKGVVEINKVVCKKTIRILFDCDDPDEYFENNTAEYVWCVDSRYKLPEGGLEWAPDNTELPYIHNFHLKNQLQDYYPEDEGGVTLYPRDWKKLTKKYHGIMHLDSRLYPVMYVSDPSDYSQRNIYNHDYVWLIDKNYKINEETLQWTPSVGEPEQYIHNFRMPQQLKEKYPRAMGGIYLVPKNWMDAQIKIHKGCHVENEEYDTFFTNKPFNASTYEFYANRSLTDWFWIVDLEYNFNGKLSFVPDKHDGKVTHVFHFPGQLPARYPDNVADLPPDDTRNGGIRLVHKQFDITKNKVCRDILPIIYDVFFVHHTELNNYTKYEKLSNTSMFYLVDEELVFDIDSLNYVPEPWAYQYVHTWHLPPQLEYRYDNEGVGPIKLVPNTFVNDGHYKLIIGDLFIGNYENLSKITYPVIRSKTVSDLFDIDEDIPGLCWLVDDNYIIDNDKLSKIWNPSSDTINYIHNFKLANQLTELYPDEMGGIYWLPDNWRELKNTKNTLVIHGSQAWQETNIDAEFPIFYNEEEANNKCKDERFYWLIDPDVTVVDDFDFNFQPEFWDHDKTHIWQKCNPVTNSVFDYGGIQLVSRHADKKKRPKHILEPGCYQKQIPIHTLTNETSLAKQMFDFSVQAKNNGFKMFWVLDSSVVLHDEWDFSYYPSQWEQNFVHVFQNTNGEYRDVRLVPTNFIEDNADLTLSDFTYNNLENLKYIDIIATTIREWPVIKLNVINVEIFLQELQSYRNQGISYVWTVSSYVDVNEQLIKDSFQPAGVDNAKIHIFQDFSPHTGRLHSYGRVMLWPTDGNYSNLTSKQIETASIKDKKYVKEVGSTYKKFDVALITYRNENADERFAKLKEKVPHAIHIKDVKGIFEAHKAAAGQSTTEMLWVVDGDAEIVDDFNFDYIPDIYDTNTVHVYTTINPITGDKYGYGGVKLFNRNQIMKVDNWGLDFTTGLSKDFKLMDEVSNITAFNTSPLSTWRSAFREVVKLTLKGDNESFQRLFIWSEPEIEDADYIQYAKDGAEQGYNFVIENSNKPEKLQIINDFDELEKMFNAKYET